MANPQRGEVELVIGETRLTLCLTLGALAEIEALCPPGARLDAERLVQLVVVLARGGGHTVDPEKIRTAPLGLRAAAEAVAACLDAGLA